MKELVKTSRTMGYLEKIYRELNKDYFNGELEEVILTIQSTPHAYGHVTCAKVWRRKDSFTYELNIGAGTLGRPIEQIVATMLHEMVHIYHLMNGIQDTSRGNTYHNKKFKEKAESVDLTIEYDKKIGWSITSPSDKLFEYVLSKRWTEINMNRQDGFRVPLGTKGPAAVPEDGKTRKPSSTRKYICPKCGSSVRATREISIICGECYDNTEEVIHMVKA